MIDQFLPFKRLCVIVTYLAEPLLIFGVLKPNFGFHCRP